MLSLGGFRERVAQWQCLAWLNVGRGERGFEIRRCAFQVLHGATQISALGEKTPARLILRDIAIQLVESRLSPALSAIGFGDKPDGSFRFFVQFVRRSRLLYGFIQPRTR